MQFGLVGQVVLEIIFGFFGGPRLIGDKPIRRIDNSALARGKRTAFRRVFLHFKNGPTVLAGIPVAGHIRTAVGCAGDRPGRRQIRSTAPPKTTASAASTFGRRSSRWSLREYRQSDEQRRSQSGSSEQAPMPAHTTTYPPIFRPPSAPQLLSGIRTRIPECARSV